MDAVFAEMIGADIGDHRHARVVRDQATPQQTPARGLQHGEIDQWVGQHHARGDRAGHVEGLDRGEQRHRPLEAGLESLETQHRYDARRPADQRRAGRSLMLDLRQDFGRCRREHDAGSEML